MREVTFFHCASRTLILADLVENFTPATPGTNLFLRIIFRALGMWNRPSPAPEYRFAWGDEARLRESMERILAWDFEDPLARRHHDARRQANRRSGMGHPPLRSPLSTHLLLTATGGTRSRCRYEQRG